MIKVIHKTKWNTKTNAMYSREDSNGGTIEQRANGLTIKQTYRRCKCNYTNNSIKCE